MSEDLPPTYSEVCQTRIVIPNIPETSSTADQHPTSSAADNAAFEGDNRPPSPSDVQVTFDYPNPNSTQGDDGDIMNELSDYQQESYVRRTIFVASYINYANQQDPTNNNRHLPAEYRQRYEQEQQEHQQVTSGHASRRLCFLLIWVVCVVIIATPFIIPN